MLWVFAATTPGKGTTMTDTVPFIPSAAPVVVPAIGDCIRLVINQNRRDCIVVEVLAEYVLAVYTMPAGRGTLTRIPHDRKPGRYDRQFWNASKAERQRHAKAILEAELERNFEREDEAENMRSGWKQRLKIKEILDQRAEIEMHLKGRAEIAETEAALKTPAAMP